MSDSILIERWSEIAELLLSFSPPYSSLSTSYCESAGQHRNGNSVYIWLIQEDRLYADKVERALDRLIHNGLEALPVLSPHETEHLRLRLETAQAWIADFEVEGESYIPVPQIPLSDFLEWLLIQWWKTHGIERCAFQLWIDGKTPPEQPQQQKP